MTLDLELDGVDVELASSVRRYCAAHPVRHDGAPEASDPVPRDWWRGLAALGVLGLGTPDVGGTVTTIVAAMEELGRANAPGPLPGTFLAGQLLDGSARRAVVDGDSLVAVGSAPLVPWLPVADVVIELDGRVAHLARPSGAIELVDTLGDEPWGRCRLERIAPLGPSDRAIAVGDAALAGYLAGNADLLVTEAAAYARDRVQFKQPIGTFQAVAHPLADCFIRVTAARTLARVAAHTIDVDDASASATAAAARCSATSAALAAAFHAHQAYGAMGFTVEGPIGGRSARIRQWSLLAPGDDHARERVLAAHGL